MKDLGLVCKKILDGCYSDSYSIKKNHEGSEQDLLSYKSSEEISDTFCFQEDHKDGLSLLFLMLLNFIRM